MVLSRNRYYMSIRLLNNCSDHYTLFNIITELKTFPTNYEGLYEINQNESKIYVHFHRNDRCGAYVLTKKAWNIAKKVWIDDGSTDEFSSSSQ